MVALELLAPAKNAEIGIAAITHGADAVYIAADKFGAREKAGNSISDIEKLVRFAHQFYAKVYVTVNTILFNNELNDAKSLIDNLYNIGVDAIIIQDLAIVQMDIPPIPLHASTQMHNISPDKINFLESVGINRVVLPRELTLEEISAYREKTNVELEFFIHGALCVSYSGQCYFSQEIAERSANRGACAQPCRSIYNLVDAEGRIIVKNKHLLSLKDLNLSKRIDDLIDSGITSFKIEGRLKDIGYVKNITAYYNNLINKAINNRSGYKRLSSGICQYFFEPDPDRSFNRGFSEHFIGGRVQNQSSFNTQKSLGKFIGSVETVDNDFISINSTEKIHNGDGLCYFNKSGVLNGFLVNKFDNGKVFPNTPIKGIEVGSKVFRNFDINFENTLKGNSATRKVNVDITVSGSNTNLTFYATDENKNSASVQIDDSFEVAQNSVKAISLIKNQLKKSGDTIFSIKSITVSNDYTPLFIPTSRLNEIRRNLLWELLVERNKNIPIIKRISKEIKQPYPESTINFTGNVSNNLSEQFYKDHGARVVEPAFELAKPKSGNYAIMTTKYCIKYELGLCPTNQNAKPTKALFLEDNHHRYPLEFDCKLCQMKVLNPKLNK